MTEALKCLRKGIYSHAFNTVLCPARSTVNKLFKIREGHMIDVISQKTSIPHIIGDS